MVLQNFYARSLLVCFYVAHNLKLHLVGKVVLTVYELVECFICG
jgi:hypothetical protein